MRFLMVCMQYPTEPGRSYMTTELSDALVAAGHTVEVLHLDWTAPADARLDVLTSATGVRVVRCPALALDGLGGVVRGASKFLLSGLRAGRVARRSFDLGSFDALITWAPAVAIAPVLAQARQAGIPRRVLFIWDFFPDHHREIGRMPGGLPFQVARAWEQRLLGDFTAVVCTLPGNADYLRRNWTVKPDQRVLVTPIWSDVALVPVVDRAAMRVRHGLPTDRPIAVFGGQMVEGRGLEQILEAARREKRADQLLFLFVGDGRLAPIVRAEAARAANVAWRPGLPRDDYLALLTACDVGLVATVPGVTSYSIPSKTIDYLRAGLPVTVAIEPGNDFVAELERYGVGVGIPFGQPARFGEAAARLATDPAWRAAIRTAAPRCLEEFFHVRRAVEAVLEAAA
ncbi:glycosyltransferase family 4 protein [Caulobacter sp. BK020]|uniref:glycosyltransferase family 4 protein n=1 Tax=Caulobacter sp. BK020 TaxID=2512117 RepID=UPI0010429B84|nr:glycosyltransferase family 4 protein [Caulobacter sp. BK020]TCS14914.1 glycosyltransferase involved in cell wall biosynthesis [Caulobacter sp. BK020]